MILISLTAIVALILGFLIGAIYFRAVISSSTPIVVKGIVYKSEAQTLTSSTEVVIKKPALTRKKEEIAP